MNTDMAPPPLPHIPQASAIRPKKSRTNLIAGIVIAFIVACGIFILIAIALAVHYGSALPFGSRVALIHLEGAIYDSSEFLKELEYHSRDSRVRAMVVRIESPGGAVAASQEIYAELNKYRTGKRTGHKVPVVISFGNVAASGGYYVACAGDRIVSNPGTITGSIGVIFSVPEASQILNTIGLKFNTIKSGELKDAGSMTRPMTDKERAYLQTVIDNVHQQFQADVIAGRRDALIKALAAKNNTPEANVKDAEIKQYIASLADGRILSGKEAREAGLVDELGTIEDAIKLACKLGGVSTETPASEMPRHKGLAEALFGSAENLLRFANRAAGAPLQYRLPW
ncbi:MAG: signal peptide peptidase SppA [Candidatus Sumerlaeota bacterium]|nr:signal peptide peptidase SppA [Candidatus Sumerlaeota bacterium]